ncbi:MAG: class I tRNA ligase family protein [Candidatus Harrisonbacteria bacterium]|nr:class I tRNA ligase family protein [Candidatus Harrisonbacteria bacterium]
MLRGLKQLNLPEIEEKVLKFWKENRIFEKAQKLREGAKKYRFFEGPPTANGRPHMGHVEGRAYKDVIPRFKTMQGYFVRRKAGWDTHGLPVEIEVEKELGLKNKQDIEKFGIAEFNEKAKASVWKYQDEWEKFTDRIGFWLDLKNPYVTYKNDYIESLWWVFKQIANRSLLRQSFKIVPYCPRCQTPLSSHEMGQPGVYKKVKDPSIYVKFELKVKSSRIKAKEHLLVWTTTPWTLPSNVAIAVNPELSYTKYKVGKDFIWSFSAPPGDGGAEVEVVEKVSGKKLVGLNYKPLFKVSGPWLKNNKFFKVYGADFVSTEEGTGMVHIAPAFGEDDMNLVKSFQKELVGQIPITIDEKGIVRKGLPGQGKFAKKADEDILKDLEKRKNLYKSGVIEHDYPFCWRCGTTILYYARFSWFIEMSGLRDQLLKNNGKINWVPEHIKEGRFGEWLREIKDWAISRDRYWGTPLPIWKCVKCDHLEVIGSLRDLDNLAYARNNFFLLRHGEAEHNLNDLIASGPEKGKQISKLTEKGKKDAETAAHNIKKMLGKEKLDLIVTSPYRRTKQTAKIVAKGTKAEIITDERLGELNCGIFNWRKIKEHKEFFGDSIKEFTKTPPGGENLSDAKKRMFAAVGDINFKCKDKNILIVSHGDPLWVLAGALGGLSNEEILKSDYPKNNGEVRKAEFHNWPYNSNAELDLHRPYIDSVFLRCKKCENRMERVKEVADVWFDSGAMPFAQDHYPFACTKEPMTYDLRPTTLKECTDFPADYISEGIDQTRGWFYTLLAVATALGLENPYKNVITLGLVLDKNGQKMSKSKGNVVSPWDMMNKYGADTVRWYFYTVNPPSEPKKFDEADLGKMLRKFIMIIYNSFVFFDTYAEKKLNPKPSTLNPKSILDKWVLARLNQTIQQVTDGLEKYDVGAAGKTLEVFVDDLSRWYIRRSRTRLQRPEDQNDFKGASAVLNLCLVELSKLIAPFTPFFADALFLSLNNELGITNKGNKKSHDSKFMIHNSVHLQNWPEADKKIIDHSLLEKMEEIRRLSSLALALRAEKGVKVRQPLQALEVKSKKLDVRDAELLEILKDEVNVKEVKWNQELAGDIDLDLKITPELKEEGLIRELVRAVQGLRHDANYVPKDKIHLMIEAPRELMFIWGRHSKFLGKDVGAGSVEFKRSAKFDAELNTKLEDQPIWIGVRKL